MVDTVTPPANTRQKSPWHVWVVGIAALLWNMGGGFDHVMMVSGNQDYLAQFTPEQLAYFMNFPGWLVSVWTVAVWSAIAGSILILLRNKLSAHVFVMSLGAMLVTMVHNYFVSSPSMLDVMGPFAVVFSAVSVIVTLLLIWYVRAMAAKGFMR